MVKTEIRTPDPADRPHAYLPWVEGGVEDGRCGVCKRGSGHHIHDGPRHSFIPGPDDDAMCAACDYPEQDGTRHFYIGVPAPDMVNHPPHYTAHPSGVEVIQITEHLNFCLGNVVKYVLRADLKGDAVADLDKAAWYLAREIARRKAE